MTPAMDMPRLLLASQSPRRRELLGLLGLPFDVAVPDVAEIPRPGEPPDRMAMRLSLAKARALADQATALVIACDTIVAFQGQPLGKPSDADEAAAMLRRLRGQSHTVHSAIALLDTTSGRASTDVAETIVTMREYTEAELVAYVATGDPLDKAGAYAIQHQGFHPVARLAGCYANVMGLPLCHLTRSLRARGVFPPSDVPTACQTHNDHACPVYRAILAGQAGPSPL